MTGSKEDNIIIKAIEGLKSSFWHCLIFSSVINILSLALPIYSMQVLDRVLSSSSIETLIYLSIIIFFAVFVMNIITNIRDTAFSYIARQFEKKLSEITFRQNFQDCFKSNIGTQYLKDLFSIKSFITSPNLPLMFDAPWVIIFLIVIFYIHWIPGLIITIAAIVFCFMAFLNQKILKADSEKLNELNVKISQKLDMLTRNSEVVMAMGMMQNLIARYEEKQEELKSLENKLKKKAKSISTIVKTLRYAIQIALTFVAAILIIQGKMSSGGMIAISTLASKVLAPFDASAGIFQAITNLKKSYQRLTKAINTTNHEDKIKLPEPKGEVVFENVVFIPTNNSAPIIKGISFKVTAGEIIGIIGKSGSGKTTIARLIAGVLEASRGKVIIDSAPINFWNKDDLGKFIGYLPQDVELFQVSIKENIARMARIGKADKTDESDEAIIKAAKLAGVHELILSFPQGYETEIGPINISAGQRQRIALARCFYGDPKVIILDEPNSNLDIDGENFLLQAIQNAKEAGITVFIIAHKPSILKIAGRIMVIGDGELKMFDDNQKVIENLGGANAK